LGDGCIACRVSVRHNLWKFILFAALFRSVLAYTPLLYLSYLLIEQGFSGCIQSRNIPCSCCRKGEKF
jgi:hypothetical protein